MSDYPNYVDQEERPEKSIENIPDEIIRKAIATCHYEECPRCGKRQWFDYVPGHNSSGSCRECGKSVTLVG